MEWLTGDLLDKLTAPSLLLLFFLLNMLGVIRTKGAVDEIRQDRDARLAEMAEQLRLWQTAYENERARGDRYASIAQESLEAVRAAEDALKGLRAASVAVAEQRKGIGG